MCMCVSVSNYECLWIYSLPKSRGAFVATVVVATVVAVVDVVVVIVVIVVIFVVVVSAIVWLATVIMFSRGAKEVAILQ